MQPITTETPTPFKPLPQPHVKFHTSLNQPAMRLRILGMVFFLSTAWSLSAQQNDLIRSYSGQLKILEEPPASLELDSLVSDSLLFVFVERETYVLSTDLVLDLTQPGDYFDDTVIPDSLQTWELLNPGVLPAGTEVHSLYFHHDNETYNETFDVFNYLNCIGQYQVNAEVTFNYPVLGIIMRAGFGAQDHLGISNDELGLPSVEYDEDNFRSFPGINIVDGCQSDRFILSDDRYTLTLKNNSDIHHDNYRVILDASQIVSVEDPEETHQIQVYPNPTRDIINLEFNDSETYHYTLSNHLGQRMASGTLPAGQNSLSLAEYQNGIYYIHLRHGTAESTIRVVKY